MFVCVCVFFLLGLRKWQVSVAGRRVFFEKSEKGNCRFELLFREKGNAIPVKLSLVSAPFAPTGLGIARLTFRSIRSRYEE